MAIVVRMPSVAAGTEEATVANWLVSPGDAVTAGTPLAEIETEKALVEYEAEDPGTVGRLVVPAGGTVEIGSPIAVLLAVGESDAGIDAALGTSAGTAPASASTDTVPASPAPAGTVPASTVPASTATSAAMTPGAAAEAPRAGAVNGHSDAVAGAAATASRVFASPIVRKLAGEKGVDLASVTGTGPNGRIVRRDLERRLAASSVPAAPAASPAPAPAASPVPAPPGGPAPSIPAGTVSANGDRLIPHTPMRRAIARRLAESKATVPHFYLTAECEADELLALRARVNEALPVKVSVNDFVVLAVAAAFGDVPEANVTWSEEGLVAHDTADISIAVATDGGLVTPVLRDAGSRKLSEIARATRDLAARARDRRLRQDEIEGGVFSVSNLGMYGTREFSAIINPPQSGILAVGAARQQPVARDGELAVATVLRCTLSVDHRAIDGALAARWLAAFTNRIERPLGMLV
ncbi:MAG TPA: dihydrolipoamide acetyltransferase family protein [Trebonia sp.]